MSASCARSADQKLTGIDTLVKRYRKKDPFRKREAEKYAKPIPSREYILQYLEELGEPVNVEHLVDAFGLEDEDDIVALSRRLRAMSRQGQLLRNRRGKYAFVEKLETIRGRVISRKDGHGFVVPDIGGEDIFLSPFEMQSVFPDDSVLVQIVGFDRRGRFEGSIVEIVERNTTTLVGRFQEEEGMYFVEPDKKTIHHDIIVNEGDTSGAKPGQYVVVRVTRYPTNKRQATGQIVEILGDHLAPGMEIEVAIRAHGLRHIWPDQVKKEVKNIPHKVIEDDIQEKGRKDLRHIPFVTIDGEDAQDFDDAVYCEAIPNGGWRLYVAIADVSHYVKPESPLDVEAKLRGNSVYFPGRVIPMLPEVLSNGLCSLRPKVDRLAMVCQLRINEEGRLSRFQFYTAVIHSQARLTYTGVAQMLKERDDEGDAVFKNIKNLHRLYNTLRKRRTLRGALDFETTETRIIFGEGHKIKKIVPVERNDAHKIIEECMLVANVATARFLMQNKMPVMYRVHEGPSDERLEKLRDFLKGVGLRLTGGKSPTSKDYAKLLDRIENRPDAHIIQLVLLRSLSQALYTSTNQGHFGLAYDEYCHFTSPIRRYPDLLIHRALKYAIDNKPVEKFPYNNEVLADVGRYCSKTERDADLASRDVEDWLKCHYMLDKVGQVHEGIISDILSFGMFIKLKDIYVEGLLHITALNNDYFVFDAPNHKLIGRRSGKIYRLGDTITVQVARVDLDEREVDFVLPEGKTKTKSAKVKKSKKGKGKDVKKSYKGKKEKPAKKAKKPKGKAKK